MHAGNLAVDKLFGRADDALVEVFLADGGDGAGEVRFLFHTIADSHHLVELVGCGLQGYLQGFARSDVGRQRLIAHIAELELLDGGGYFDGEVAIDVGGGAAGSPDSSHADANQWLG